MSNWFYMRIRQSKGELEWEELRRFCRRWGGLKEQRSELVFFSGCEPWQR
jgi:hypothetical protein